MLTKPSRGPCPVGRARSRVPQTWHSANASPGSAIRRVTCGGSTSASKMSDPTNSCPASRILPLRRRWRTCRTRWRASCLRLASRAPALLLLGNPLERRQHLFPGRPGVIGLVLAAVPVLSQTQPGTGAGRLQRIGQAVIVLGCVVLPTQRAEVGDLEAAFRLEGDHLSLVLVRLAL